MRNKLLLGYGGNSVARMRSYKTHGWKAISTTTLNLFEIRAVRWLMKITLVMKLRQIAKREKSWRQFILRLQKYDNPQEFPAGGFLINYFF